MQSSLFFVEKGGGRAQHTEKLSYSIPSKLLKQALQKEVPF